MIDDDQLSRIAGVTPYQVRKILQAMRQNADGLVLMRDEPAGKVRVILAGEVGGGSIQYFESEPKRARDVFKSRFGGRIHNLNKA